MKLHQITTPALAVLLLSACGGDPPVINSISVDPTEAAPGDDVTLTVDVGNFELRPPSDHTGHQGLSPADDMGHDHDDDEGGDYPDGGHFHVYLDTVETNPLMVNCPDHCEHPAWSNSQEIRIPDDAAPGPHEIIVRLNHDDHRSLTPHIMMKTPLTVTSTSG